MIEFVVLLELLKDFCNIKECDVLKLDKAISLFADCYSDELLERVVGEIKYPYSVVGMLEKRLAEKRTANRCIEIYKKIYWWCDCAISSRQKWVANRCMQWAMKGLF